MIDSLFLRFDRVPYPNLRKNAARDKESLRFPTLALRTAKAFSLRHDAVIAVANRRLALEWILAPIDCPRLRYGSARPLRLDLPMAICRSAL